MKRASMLFVLFEVSKKGRWLILHFRERKLLGTGFSCGGGTCSRKQGNRGVGGMGGRGVTIPFHVQILTKFTYHAG